MIQAKSSTKILMLFDSHTEHILGLQF